MTTPDLTDRVAVVTGASSGLGRRFAITLAAAGARVAAMGRRVDRLKELSAEVESGGGICSPVRLDVTDATGIGRAVDTAETELGPIDILVNNAGVPDAQYATKMSLELIDTVLATNLRAPFLLSCEVARRWIDRKTPGRIVNISSMAAYCYVVSGSSLYSITKAAVNRMTETLAVEWAPFGINVNAIAPGSFESEMMAGMISRQGEMTAMFPRGRMGKPEQLDSTLLYLLSPNSEFVTGTIIKVDDCQIPR
ncbi:MAG TPA: SDR family NAD(P)-dependent oxidoreductase [Acidimicrobiales bacterium]|nr:SDR family NAD(P)-dependent oxidoreductase [Acidimicrobiales bacterium]